MEVIEVKGAKTFIKTLSLDNIKFKSSFKTFIFRGQSNANWSAIPSAFRCEGGLLSYNELWPIGLRTNRDQVEAEFITLSSLVEELNQNGFHIPNEEILNMESSSQNYTEFITKIGRNESIWPPQKYHSLMSIAQHYGMPTRLLDFTYDPYVALYFAAKGVLNGHKSEYLAVYALDVHSSKITKFDFNENNEQKKSNQKQEKNKIYQLIKSPSSFNHNLRNQKGVFLAAIDKNFKANGTFKPYSLDQYFDDESIENDCYKFQIKSNCAEEIMQLLHNRFYSASTMFPSIEGCVKSVYEKHALSYWK